MQLTFQIKSCLENSFSATGSGTDSFNSSIKLSCRASCLFNTITILNFQTNVLPYWDTNSKNSCLIFFYTEIHTISISYTVYCVLRKFLQTVLRKIVLPKICQETNWIWVKTINRIKLYAIFGGAGGCFLSFSSKNNPNKQPKLYLKKIIIICTFAYKWEKDSLVRNPSIMEDILE